MMFLSLICAVISLAVVAVCVLWQRFAPPSDGLAQEKALYAGYVADVERRLSAGELDAEAAQEEQAEAARALLKTAGSTGTVADAGSGRWGMWIAVAAAAVAFGLYLFIGHPQMAGQPYGERLARWTRQAQENPDSVPPQVMAAVLRQGQAEHGDKPDYWLLTGRFLMLAGNNYDGMKAYKRAWALSPQTFKEWSALGEAVTLTAGGAINKEARLAFEEAVKRDPDDARAHFYLGQAAVADARFDDARQHFLTAIRTTSPDNPSRPAIEAELRNVDVAQASDVQSKARITAMVGSLAVQLKADPENADGWARLLRSYDVLGDAKAHEAALATMQAHYRDRPQIAAAIVEKSKAAVGAQ